MLSACNFDWDAKGSSANATDNLDWQLLEGRRHVLRTYISSWKDEVYLNLVIDLP